MAKIASQNRAQCSSEQYGFRTHRLEQPCGRERGGGTYTYGVISTHASPGCLALTSLAFGQISDQEAPRRRQYPSQGTRNDTIPCNHPHIRPSCDDHLDHGRGSMSPPSLLSSSVERPLWRPEVRLARLELDGVLALSVHRYH